MLIKEQVVETVQQMPQEFSIDSLMSKLLFLSKVEKGLSQSAKGQVLSQKETKQKLSKWLE